MLLDDVFLSIFFQAAQLTALAVVVNFELKARLTNWFKFDTCCCCMEEEEDGKDGGILFGLNTATAMVAFIS